MGTFMDRMSIHGLNPADSPAASPAGTHNYGTRVQTGVISGKKPLIEIISSSPPTAPTPSNSSPNCKEGSALWEKPPSVVGQAQHSLGRPTRPLADV